MWWQVSYREAITRPAEVDYTHKKQSGGSGQFARVKLEFTPLDPDDEGSDFEFISEIKGGVVPKEYIPGVQKVSPMTADLLGPESVARDPIWAPFVGIGLWCVARTVVACLVLLGR